MRAARRSRGGVSQAADAATRVPSQPAVQRLAADSVAFGHFDDAAAGEDLKHCLVALFHDPQLDEHGLTLPGLIDPSDRSSRKRGLSRQARLSHRCRSHCRPGAGATVARRLKPRLRTVAQLPEPLCQGCTEVVHAASRRLPPRCRQDASSRPTTAEHAPAPSLRRTLDCAALLHIVDYDSSPPTDVCKISIGGSTPPAASNFSPANGHFFPAALTRGRPRADRCADVGPTCFRRSEASLS